MLELGYAAAAAKSQWNIKPFCQYYRFVCNSSFFVFVARSAVATHTQLRNAKGFILCYSGWCDIFVVAVPGASVLLHIIQGQRLLMQHGCVSLFLVGTVSWATTSHLLLQVSTSTTRHLKRSHISQYNGRKSWFKLLFFFLHFAPDLHSWRILSHSFGIRGFNLMYYWLHEI